MNGNQFGRLFRMTTYGESHGPGMGVTVSGCPAGLKLDREDIQRELDRRKPGQSKVTTSRAEPDAVTINSGIQDARSGKYEPFITAPRPSHGDFTYSAKFGTRNWGGGGRSSARETANWVAAGAIARKVNRSQGIEVRAHVNQIGDVQAPEVSWEQLADVEDNEVRCADPETAEEMREVTDDYQEAGDSIGGSVYFEIRGAPRGLGAPRFDSVPARLGTAMMAIPAVTAFEFGLGKDAREISGSERNEDWTFNGESEDSEAENERGDPVPTGNDHAGLQGGITTGQPIYGELTWHAPTSIPKAQETVDWETGEHKQAQVIGRHDPVLPPRAVPVVEAMAHLTLVDFMLLSGRVNPDRLDGRVGEYDTDYHPSSPQNDPEDAPTRAEPSED
ncbi:chorismate synthase [Halobacteriales archaeon QH_8_64_26]|nr:MAG: chorismate synthase [Halobacteriales archaeon QH_8_64_26]